MAAIECTALTKFYGASRGIEGIDLAIEPGEIFGCLGPNGAGKTTTLRCLMGLLRPDAGEARLLGEPVIAGAATLHARIGYLPGEFRNWGNLTAGRSLRILAGLNRSACRPRRQELAERLHLDLKRPVRTLSKGNRQKVAVISAFQHQPRILILDEPTSGLDPLVRQTVLQLIRESAATGSTILLSSHDLDEVAAVCGRAAILRGGHRVDIAPITRLMARGEHQLKVWFASEPPAMQAEAEIPPAARILKREAGFLHLAYQGPAGPVLQWLARLPVDRIETPQATLEEAFLDYYQDPGTGRNSHAETALNMEESP